jgi:hypothetical protein
MGSWGEMIHAGVAVGRNTRGAISTLTSAREAKELPLFRNLDQLPDYSDSQRPSTERKLSVASEDAKFQIGIGLFPEDGTRKMDCVKGANDGREGTGGASLDYRSKLDEIKAIKDSLE